MLALTRRMLKPLLNTQDVPGFFSVVEDEECNHNDLLEDELQFEELLEDFAMAEHLPGSADEWAFAQEDSIYTLFFNLFLRTY